jgi:hypothetical protein
MIVNIGDMLEENRIQEKVLNYAKWKKGCRKSSKDHVGELSTIFILVRITLTIGQDW